VKPGYIMTAAVLVQEKSVGMRSTSTGTPRERRRRSGGGEISCGTEGKKSTRARPRFLVVGDSKEVGPALQSVFAEPYDVVRIESAEEALQALGSQGADVVLLDSTLIGPQGPATNRSAEDESGTIVWMAVDTKAVTILGELLKSMAANRDQAKPTTARASRVRKRGSSAP
jgi:hypothetical protein